MNMLTILLIILQLHATPTDQITTETLETRTPSNPIIEYCTGIVVNDDYDGIITNTNEDYYNYISYSCLSDVVHPGDVIETYFIYNPDTNYIDDILYRIDILPDGNVYIN